MRNSKLWFDRALSRSIWRQLAIMGVILLICYGFSCLLLSGSDTWRCFCEDHDGICYKFLLPLYLLIDQNFFNAIYLDHSSIVDYRLIVASGITYILGLVFFGGAIIAILSDFIKRRVDNYKHGRTFYIRKGHYLIMGYDDIVPSIIMHLLEKKPDAQILILSSEPTQQVLEKLRESVARNYLDNIVINYGHRTSSTIYPDIHLESAEQIFIAGDRTKAQHDAINVQCIESICTYLQDYKTRHTIERITCVFENLDTYVSFCTTDIFTHLTKSLNIPIVPYNKYVSWANQVFVRRQYRAQAGGQLESYPLVYGNGINPDDDMMVHLVFVGTSTFAVSFAREASQFLHFSNFNDKIKSKTRITFIDNNMDVEMEEIITRYRHLFEVQSYLYGDYTKAKIKKSAQVKKRLKANLPQTDFLDIEFEFIKGDIFSDQIQDLLCEWQNDLHQYLSLFIAMSKQHKNFAIAMNLPNDLYEKRTHDGWNTPIFIRQDNADNFVTLLRQQSIKSPDDPKALYYWLDENKELHKQHRDGIYANIYPFGMNDSAFYVDEESIRRAKLINYLYSSMKDGHFLPLTVLASLSAETIWKEANRYWKDLSVAVKWSNLYFAYSLHYKELAVKAMREAGLDEDQQIETLSVMEHNRWNVEKLLMGYRKPLEIEDLYDKSDDIARKLKNNKNLFIHAQIRPYDDLSDDMKELDKEFARYIPWIIQTTK